MNAVHGPAVSAATKCAWVAPVLEEMPRLTDLTLSSDLMGGPINGEGKIMGGQASTVF